MNAGHEVDHEPVSPVRKWAMLLQCRVRRELAGCPCDQYCRADLENGCLPVRPQAPIEGWQSRVETMFGL